MDVWNCSHASGIPNQMHLLWDWIVFKVLADQLVIVISRCIINNYYLVICVVLVEDRTEVVLVPKVLTVVESWHHDAEGQLRKIEIVLLAESIVLSA